MRVRVHVNERGRGKRAGGQQKVGKTSRDELAGWWVGWRVGGGVAGWDFTVKTSRESWLSLITRTTNCALKCDVFFSGMGAGV